MTLRDLSTELCNRDDREGYGLTGILHWRDRGTLPLTTLGDLLVGQPFPRPHATGIIVDSVHSVALWGLLSIFASAKDGGWNARVRQLASGRRLCVAEGHTKGEVRQ